MRVLLCLFILTAACSRPDAAAPPRDSTRVASTFRGPDPLYLRVAREGGIPRVVGYPNVDSTVWQADRAIAAPGRVLGFDDDAGIVAMIDARARPLLLDLRGGRIDDSVRTPVVAPVSIDGSTIYAVTAKGEVVRRSPSDFWRFTGSSPARGVFPLRDGSILIWSGREQRSMLSRVRPPDKSVEDSLSMPAADVATGTGVGDRLYFAAGSALHSVQTRTMQASEPIDVGSRVVDVTVTPSGDRIFALTEEDGASSLVGVDRYSSTIAARLDVGSGGRELRVDPIGRYVLVRGAGDSVRIVDVGRNSVVGAIRSEWRPDLPMVAPDGAIVTVEGADVVFHRAADQSEIRRVTGGASDFWFAFWWTGFRTRAVTSEAPVILDSVDLAADSVVVVGAATDTAAPPVRPDSGPPKATTFTVSFFTLLSESRAQAEAAKIQVGGETARVETVLRGGVPVYRVILGPYPTCADAQRVARESGRQVWIPEGGCDVPPFLDEQLAR